MAQKKTYIMAENELQKPEGADVEFYSGDVTGLVKRLRGVGKKDIWLVGGSKVISAFMNARLIDRFIIFVVPIILTKGIHLFTDIDKEAVLRCRGATHYKSGLVELDYRMD